MTPSLAICTTLNLLRKIAGVCDAHLKHSYPELILCRFEILMARLLCQLSLYPVEAEAVLVTACVPNRGEGAHRLGPVQAAEVTELFRLFTLLGV